MSGGRRRSRSCLLLPLSAALLSVVVACSRAGDEPPGRPKLPPIAVSASTNSVFLVDPATGERREVVGGLPDFQAGFASWSPDHRRLALGQDAVVIVDPRTSRRTVVVRGRGLSMPAWSPDGTHLAYSDGLTLWITELSRVRPARIRIPAVLAPLDLAWAPGGDIAFEGLDLDCTPVVRCVSTGTSDIWTIRSDGTGLTKLTSARHAEGPKWSPEGTRLLHVRHYRGDRPSELWTVTADGLEQHRLLVAEDLVAADWSPDGRRLAVLRGGSRAGTLELWIGAPDGSALERVGEPFEAAHAAIDW